MYNFLLFAGRARLHSLYATYDARNSAAVKSVTKASQWRKLGMQGRRRESRAALYLLIVSFAGNLEGQTFVRSTELATVSRLQSPSTYADRPIRT
ncbi:hypothetical protein EVAR_48522_1 [Eumeta japonica]|uniref:Uncharacterized protein n=1 Tax=Eumeta variegata TaxID=151549 RepID=A0A4C1Z1N5_EUMVA|nr:hypothetical protein EVAR_48522_1 [Eumeta japonica]